MRKSAVLLPLLCALAAPVAAQTALTPDEAALKAHVAFLADDVLKGREPGTPEFDAAADYVASRMLAAGLTPAGDNGGWYQRVPLVAIIPGEKGTMSLTRGGKEAPFVFGKDFVTGVDPLVSDFSISGDVVFAGYGVVDKASGRDDYKGLDARGKIVAVLYGGPADLPSEVRAHYGERDTKAEFALAHGAKAVLFIESSMLHTVYPFDRIAATWGRAGMVWAEADGRPHLAVPAMPGAGLLSFAGAAKLFAGTRFNWDAVLAADAAGKKIPTGDLGVTVSLHQTGTTKLITSANVVGLLEGSDPTLKAETVILSAHLDHIGISDPDERGDTINNGAMDNAVGTASMLEVARAFQTSGKRPRRSMLFVAVHRRGEGADRLRLFRVAPDRERGHGRRRRQPRHADHHLQVRGPGGVWRRPHQHRPARRARRRGGGRRAYPRSGARAGELRAIGPLQLRPRRHSRRLARAGAQGAGQGGDRRIPRQALPPAFRRAQPDPGDRLEPGRALREAQL